jgi:apolipoprotein N-acyltransferase
MREPRAAVSRAPVGPWAAAAGGGILYCLGYVGWGLWPCLAVFLVPFWAALEATRRRTLGASLVAGLVFGFAAFAGGFAWLWRLVDVFLAGSRGVGALLWLVYGGWFAAGFVVYAALFHAIRNRGHGIAAAGIAPLLVVEWLQPQVFPVHAGSGLVRVPLLMQTADLGGPLLLTALVACTNAAVFATWQSWRRARPRPLRVWAVTAAGLAAVVAYGAVRIAWTDAAAARAPALRVGLVQANLGLLEKRRQSLVTHSEHLALTRALLADGPLDLVVWPETAYVRGLRRPLPISGRPVREDLPVPLLFGGATVWQGDDGRTVKANSALLVAEDGTIHDAYDKNLLIPLAEYVPLARVVPGIAAWFPHVEEFGAASDTPPLRLGAWRLATPICYEAVRPDFVRRMMARTRAHLLVTLANDAWFGDSQEPWIHLSLARLRAVEHRRFLVRATNSGVSAVVDPAGRLVARTGVLARDTLRAVVHPLEGETPYARVGDWPGWLAAAAVVAALTRRAAGGSPPARG